MSDLREAAKRLRNFNFAALGTDHCNDATQDAIKAVCRAYLTEHPADSDTLIDAEWMLEACGWVKNGVCYSPPTSPPFVVWWSEDGCTYLGTMALPNVRTRGDLRDLCRLAGVELQEPNSENSA